MKSVMLAFLFLFPLANAAQACRALSIDNEHTKQEVLQNAYYIGEIEILKIEPIKEKRFDSDEGLYKLFQPVAIYELRLKKDYRLNYESKLGLHEAYAYDGSCSKFPKYEGAVFDGVVVQKGQTLFMYEGLEPFTKDEWNGLKQAKFLKAE